MILRETDVADMSGGGVVVLDKLLLVVEFELKKCASAIASDRSMRAKEILLYMHVGRIPQRSVSDVDVLE